jgi:hypothetical protein
MAKVFYLGGGTHARGMLRAVVTLEQLNSCVSADAVSYMGTAFPENEFNLAVTVVEISPDEAAQPWAIGFSRINETLAEFDERLKFLPESEKPPKKMPQQKRRNSFGLIHWLMRDTRSCE